MILDFGLRRPCAHCPFRADRPFGLRPGRAEWIARDLYEKNLTFACHETTRRRRGPQQHCAGALILHEKLGRPNWRIRLAWRLGLFDPARLDMAAPVVDTIADFVRIASTEAVKPADRC